jgi:GNAT superfamily N-acetyltransferase
MFRKHHYLDTNIHKAAQCFVAFWGDTPVAFASYLHFPHPKSKNIKREHRTVCLPDYQGVGIGNAVSDAVAQICRASGFRYLSISSHPAMIASRNKSKNWKMITKPNIKSKTIPYDMDKWSGGSNGAPRRFRTTFEYVGDFNAPTN